VILSYTLGGRSEESWPSSHSFRRLLHIFHPLNPWVNAYGSWWAERKDFDDGDKDTASKTTDLGSHHSPGTLYKVFGWRTDSHGCEKEGGAGS
jgi:hypothetical protein